MDLNLIRVFIAVFESRNVTTAAQRLHVTPSAVSQQLTRLRQALDDRLFQREDRVMLPTTAAVKLYPTFRDALISVDSAVGTIKTFDPATSARTFRIALSELGEIGWFPNFVSEIASTAPNVQIHSVALDPDKTEHWLQSGHVDVAISSQVLASHFERTAVKEQTFSVVMSQDHPLADAELTLTHYASASRVLIAGDSSLQTLLKAEKRADIFSTPHIVIQRYATLMPLLQQHPTLLAVIPTSLAYGWAKQFPIVVRQLPFAMAAFRLFVYLRSQTHDTAGLDWFYEVVTKSTLVYPTLFEAIGSQEHHARKEGQG
jgi:DNA-binding transcriptional LysR family regulator